MKLFWRILPWCFVALFGAEIVAVMLPKRDGEYHVREFGRLPVLLNGRIQPFDSVARNCLLQIRSTGDVPLEVVTNRFGRLEYPSSWKFWHHPKKLKATEWLLEVMTRPEVADSRPVFLIHHSDLLGELKLQDKGIVKSGLRYYTFDEIKPVLDVISDQGRKAGQMKPEEQTSFQKQVLKLANAVSIYQRLKVTLQPDDAQNFANELAQFQQNLPAAQAAAQAGERSKDFDKAAVQRVARPLEDFRTMATYGYPRIVPPPAPSGARDQWQNAGSALLEAFRSQSIHPAVSFFAAMATAYQQHKPEDFNRALAGYQAWLAPRFGRELAKGGAEFYYNDVKAFLHATIIYLFAFVLAGGSILTLAVTPNLSESFRRSAFYLIILAGLVHTFGLVFRMVLEGRPPVTNLYSSAIFVGWGMMVLGIVIERIYRVGIGSLVAALAGFITLLIAHNLALGGDTMEMLRAVLDTNFWLAAHVVTIVIGYSATFGAGLLGILYVFLGLFTPLLGQKLAASGPPAPAAGPRSRIENQSSRVTLGQALGKMVYGVVCFATLFSFVGTVLGGIWADQSWGRFWGWDPKENGALIIVLWNAIILHARWGGLVRDRGIMNLAIFGNIVTSFSYFGVNLLGVGLHSYGFTDTGAGYLMNFVSGQLVLIGNGMLPLRAWKSQPQQAGRVSLAPFRVFLALLDAAWVLASTAWFAGIYQAQPWVTFAGEFGSLVLLALIWLLVVIAHLVRLFQDRAQALSLPAPPPLPAG